MVGVHGNLLATNSLDEDRPIGFKGCLLLMLLLKLIPASLRLGQRAGLIGVHRDLLTANSLGKDQLIGFQ